MQRRVVHTPTASIQHPKSEAQQQGRPGSRQAHPPRAAQQGLKQHPTFRPATLETFAKEQLQLSTGTSSSRHVLLHGDSKVSSLAPGRTVQCTAVHDRKSWSRKVLFPARSRQSARSTSLRHLNCSTRGVCTPALCLRCSTQLASTITVIVRPPAGPQLGWEKGKSPLFL
jgi:hypothetical protein